MDLGALIKGRGRQVHTILGELTLEDAFRALTEMKTPALVVIEKGEPAGLLTQANVLRFLLRSPGRLPGEIRVAEVMSPDWRAAEADDDMEAHLASMLELDIEVLPVADGGKIIGVLLLKDLLQHRIDALISELHLLQEYVASLQDAFGD